MAIFASASASKLFRHPLLSKYTGLVYEDLSATYSRDIQKWLLVAPIIGVLTGLITANDLKITVKHDDTKSPCTNAPNQSYVISPSNVLPGPKPTGTTQVVKFALPYGSWIISVVNNKPKTINVTWDKDSAPNQAFTQNVAS